jgi:hypothetical protein
VRERIHRDSPGTASTAANQEIGVGKRTLTEQLTMPSVQRKVGGSSAAHLMSDFRTIQAKAGPGAPADDRGSQAAASDGPGQAMPADVQRKMEASFGASFADVRIHEGPGAQALGARAYTRGTDLYFAPGEYQPNTAAGQELLGHELTHVVQQSRGQVQATTQLRGLGLNDSSALETEADQQGARAARGARVTMAGTAPEAGGAHTAAGPAMSASSSTLQRSIKLVSAQDPMSIEQALHVAAAATADDDMTKKLAEWYVSYLHNDGAVHGYPDEPGLIKGIQMFVLDWKKGLATLGVTGDTDTSASNMHKAFRIYNREPPPHAEALVYKLDDRYAFLKQRWMQESGKATSTHHAQGTIYDPPGGHSMPKNFAWVASVIHKQIPVRVVVPLDFRVLVREAISEDLASKLAVGGKKVVKDGKDMVEVSREDIVGGLKPAPLSATAREVLGFVGRDYYRVAGMKQNAARCETLLQPTGKPLLNPQEVFVPETLGYDQLVSLLSQLQIPVQHDDVITSLRGRHDAHERLLEERRQEEAANKKFQLFYWASSAVVALASYALATYMGQLSEG